MKLTLEFDSWDELMHWMQSTAVECVEPEQNMINPAEMTPEPEAVPDPVPEPAPVKEPSYTMDMIAGAMAALIDQGKEKMAQVAETIQKYGVPAINELDPSNYDAFAEDLKALGAAL